MKIGSTAAFFVKRITPHILIVALLVAPAICGLTQDKSAVVQPDYEKWQRVSIGMTEAELIQLLGKPEGGMRVQDNPELLQGGVTSWIYWTLFPRSKVFPGGIHFLVFMTQGKVMEKRDPHGGVLSTDGKPTIPKLLLPQNGVQFRNYSSGMVDLRWRPSAGRLPISYDVELDLSTGEQPESWFEQNHTTAEEPYLAVVAGGIQPHRWRVRAKNALGTSGWSEYFYFAITN
jgi:hypothetical protein